MNSLNLPVMVPAKRGDGEPSTNIAEYGYEPNGRGLIVRFVGGKLAFYNTVTPEGFNALAGAWSPGSHFARHIRTSHQHTYLEEEKPVEQAETKADGNFARDWSNAQARTEMEEDIKVQTPRDPMLRAWLEETREDLEG